MKSRIGFTVYEARPRDGYRHLSVEFYPLVERHIGRELVKAVERGTEWEVNHISEIVRIAGGRRVFEGDNSVGLHWQSCADFAHWYALNMGVHAGKDRPELSALQSRIVKVAASMRWESAPVDWITALDAVPIERLQDGDHRISASRLWVFSDFDEINTAIWGPDGKVKPAAAAVNGGAVCAA